MLLITSESSGSWRIIVVSRIAGFVQSYMGILMAHVKSTNKFYAVGCKKIMTVRKIAMCIITNKIVNRECPWLSWIYLLAINISNVHTEMPTMCSEMI